MPSCPGHSARLSRRDPLGRLPLFPPHVLSDLFPAGFAQTTPLLLSEVRERGREGTEPAGSPGSVPCGARREPENLHSVKSWAPRGAGSAAHCPASPATASGPRVPGAREPPSAGVSRVGASRTAAPLVKRHREGTRGRRAPRGRRGGRSAPQAGARRPGSASRGHWCEDMEPAAGLCRCPRGGRANLAARAGSENPH